MIDAYKIGVALSLNSNHAQVLQSLATGLLGINTKVKDLEGGFNRIKFAIGGVASAMAGAGILRGLADIAKHGETLLDQQEKLRRGGVDQLEVLRLTREYYRDIAASIPTATASEWLKTVNELKLTTGSLAAAEKAAPFALKLEALISSATGRSSSGQGFDLYRAVEEKLISQDPAHRDKVLNLMAQGIIGSGGKITGADWFTFARRAGVSWIHQSDDFVGGVAPTLIQSLGAQTAGTALMTAYMSLQGVGTMSKQQAAVYQQLGLLDPHHFTTDKGGRINLQPGAIVGSGDYQGDIAGWGRNILAPALQRLPEKERKSVLGMMARNRNTFRIFDTFTNPAGISQYDKDAALIKQSKGVNDAYDSFTKTNPTGAIKSFQEQWESLLQTLGGPLMKAAIPVMQFMTEKFTAFGEFASKHGTAIQRLGEALAVFGTGAVLAGITALAIATGPIGLTILALSAAVAALLVAWDKLKAVFTDIANVFTALADKLAGAFAGLKNAIQNLNSQPPMGSPMNYQGGGFGGGFQRASLTSSEIIGGGHAGWGGGYVGEHSFSPGGSAPAGSLTALINNESLIAGINPAIMEGIRAGESLHGPGYDVANTSRESSWGPFQLNRMRGLGVQFERETGLNLRDPSTIPAQVRWVAQYLKKGGSLAPWAGYHGPRNANPAWGNSGLQGGSKEPQHISLHVDGKKMAEVVTHHQTRKAWAPRSAPFHSSYAYASSPDLGFETG